MYSNPDVLHLEPPQIVYGAITTEKGTSSSFADFWSASWSVGC